MKKIILTLFVVAFFTNSAHSQLYSLTGGLRFNESRLGLTVVKRTFDHQSIEAIANIGNAYGDLGFYYRFHKNLVGRRLNMYAGPGMHFGSFANNSMSGLSGVIGAEYKMMLLPIHISYDYRPMINIGSTDKFMLQSGFSLRYVFVKSKKNKKSGGKSIKDLFKIDNDSDD